MMMPPSTDMGMAQKQKKNDENPIYLVGALEPWNFMTFQKQLGISSSQLTNSLHHFSEGSTGSTTNQNS